MVYYLLHKLSSADADQIAGAYVVILHDDSAALCVPGEPGAWDCGIGCVDFDEIKRSWRDSSAWICRLCVPIIFFLPRE
jgi:hypothetical protein